MQCDKFQLRGSANAPSTGHEQPSGVEHHATAPRLAATRGLGTRRQDEYSHEDSDFRGSTTARVTSTATSTAARRNGECGREKGKTSASKHEPGDLGGSVHVAEHLRLREPPERLPSERVRARTGQETLEAAYELLDTYTFENFWNGRPGKPATAKREKSASTHGPGDLRGSVRVAEHQHLRELLERPSGNHGKMTPLGLLLARPANTPGGDRYLVLPARGRGISN